MITIIDNYDSFTYNLYQVVACQHPNVTIIRNDQLKLNELIALQPSGIILSPGPGRPEQAGICVDLINHFSGRLPILGVCLGHQAIAHAFGGSVINAREIVHGKKNYVFHNQQNLYQHMPLPFAAARYHSLIVDQTRIPAALEIEAQTPDGLIMGIRHKTHPTFGVQFHPESILTEQGQIFLKNFVKLCVS